MPIEYAPLEREQEQALVLPLGLVVQEQAQALLLGLVAAKTPHSWNRQEVVHLQGYALLVHRQVVLGLGLVLQARPPPWQPHCRGCALS